jgi:hypothetical protein
VLKTNWRTLPALFAVIAAFAWPAQAVRAQDANPITITASSAASEFPEGMRFKLQASSATDIVSVAVRFRAGVQTSGTYDYLQFEPGTSVDAELLWRTNTSPRYIPPGTLITYVFEVEDAAGNLASTEPATFAYHDARFEWIEITKGPVTVAYHGPVESRAQSILDVSVQTIEKMGPLLGAEMETPIRVTMYNNVKEMLEALPPGSSTVRSELVTEGQAFSEVSTVLVLGGGRLSLGTASHELTHILTHRAGDSVFRSLPSWLDEGLAEYGNVDPGFSYDVALEFAIGTNRLIPVVFTQTLPGVPEDVIIYYGQSRSIVRYMIEKYSAEKMRDLMTTLKKGTDMDQALTEVYGVDRLGLYQAWLKSVAAPPYEPPKEGNLRPTPIPWPTVLPFSLTPQAEAAAVETLEQTPTPKPAPQATKEASPTPAPVAAVEATAETSQAQPQAATPTPAPVSPGGCNAPAQNTRAVEVSSAAFFLGLAGLMLTRRLRRTR